MVLYHGSNTANIKVLKPNQADHDRPYVYMAKIDVVAAFCIKVENAYALFIKEKLPQEWERYVNGTIG